MTSSARGDHGAFLRVLATGLTCCSVVVPPGFLGRRGLACPRRLMSDRSGCTIAIPCEVRISKSSVHVRRLRARQRSSRASDVTLGLRQVESVHRHQVMEGLIGVPLEFGEAVVRGAVAVGAQADQPAQRLDAGLGVVLPAFVCFEPSAVGSVLDSSAGLAGVAGSAGHHPADAFPVPWCDAAADVGEPARGRDEIDEQARLRRSGPRLGAGRGAPVAQPIAAARAWSAAGRTSGGPRGSQRAPWALAASFSAYGTSSQARPVRAVEVVLVVGDWPMLVASLVASTTEGRTDHRQDSSALGRARPPIEVEALGRG